MASIAIIGQGYMGNAHAVAWAELGRAVQLNTSALQGQKKDQPLLQIKQNISQTGM